MHDPDLPIHERAFRSPVAIGLFLATFAVLLTADLVTKVVAFDRLAVAIVGTPPARVEVVSRDYEFIPGLLHFHVTANQGAVFGIGQGKRWLFVLVSAAAIGFLLYLFGSSSRRHWPVHLLLGMFLAGVIGNMYDRLHFGYVRDMLWLLPQWRWGDLMPFLPTAIARHDVFPWIFNLADSYLVIGVTIVLLHTALARNPRPAEKDPPPVREGAAG